MTDIEKAIQKEIDQLLSMVDHLEQKTKECNDIAARLGHPNIVNEELVLKIKPLLQKYLSLIPEIVRRNNQHLIDKIEKLKKSIKKLESQ